MRAHPGVGIGGGALVVLLGVLGALGGIAATQGWTPPAELPAAMALAGVAVAVFVVASLAHAVRRGDLTRTERIVLVAGLLVVPLGSFAYLALGPERAGNVARNVARMLQPPPPEGAAG